MRSNRFSFLEITGIGIFNRRTAFDFASLDPEVWNAEG